MRNLSPSQIDTFKQCRRKWYFIYKLELGRAESTADQVLGKLMHSFVERYHSSGLSLQEFQDEIDQAYDLGPDLKLMADKMAQNYLEYELHNPLIKHGMEVVVEKELTDITFAHKGVQLVGRPDMLLIGKTDVIVVEHKTSNIDWSYEDFFMRFQPRIYHFMASHEYTGKRVSVLFNIMYKRYPVKPSVNKDGTISKAACVTTRKLFLEVIKEIGADPSDYVNVLSRIPNYTFNERYPVEGITARGTGRVLNMIIDDINRCHSGDIPYGNETFMCKRCPFLQVCVNGGDDERRLDEAVTWFKGGNEFVDGSFS